MPNYDFSCEECGNQFSQLTSIAGRKDVKCPKCGSEKIVQRLTGFLYAKSGDGNSGCSGGSCGSCSGC